MAQVARKAIAFVIVAAASVVDGDWQKLQYGGLGEGEGVGEVIRWEKIEHRLLQLLRSSHERSRNDTSNAGMGQWALGHLICTGGIN